MRQRRGQRHGMTALAADDSTVVEQAETLRGRLSRAEPVGRVEKA
ncbi:hypothetical protein ACFY7C_04790 [Streptomyces sp. NPDC012769]